MSTKRLFVFAKFLLLTCTLIFGMTPANAGPGGGSYYANSPAGWNSGTALRKFVDGMPGLGLPNCHFSSPCGSGNAATPSCNENNLCQYIPIAAPQTSPVPGDTADYYEIAVGDYTARMHSDLPGSTHLRGYHQIIGGVDQPKQYLGPLILAAQNTPVRIKFVNQLGTGTSGDLKIPVDTTIMGAGMGPDSYTWDPVTQAYVSTGVTDNYTQNRAEIHLHGGLPPWISDGTPHQWITPAGEPGIYKVGDSLRNVPDMMPYVASSTGTVQAEATAAQTQAGLLSTAVNDGANVPLATPAEIAAALAIVNAANTASVAAAAIADSATALAAQQAFDNLNLIVVTSLFPSAVVTNPLFTPANVATYKLAISAAVRLASQALNNAGYSTYFYPNDQSSRLMFYHDHSYGTTRLNVYAGEAAGYLLADAAEEGLINANTLPNICPGGGTAVCEYRYGVPLIIQDKTFVPKNVAVQDATWDTTKWGKYNDSLLSGPLTADLWFPHVYEPNQSPGQPGGMNPTGRWDYAPWFWPVISIPNLKGPLPDPSIVPEAFMDTPLVNGTAYPKMTVEKKRYRFRILNGSNDRTLNLGLYYAEPLTVSVISGGFGYSATPSVTFTGGNAGGGTPTQATGTATVVGGVVTGVTVTSPGSGYTSYPNVTISDPTGVGAQAVASVNTEIKMMTRTDGRPGGQPDLTAQDLTTLPKIILVGTEGGLLPAPVVGPGTTSQDNLLGLNNPPTALGYDNDPRSITVTNIKYTNLLVGPAQRVDIIVDFSTVAAGSTLILYNDSPAPAPASDLRYDYYTGDPDNTPTGGAPSTLPGYGPNTRTIMQFKVVNAVTPDTKNYATTLSDLTTALPGLFTSTQPAPIIAPNTYVNNFSTTIKDVNNNDLPIQMKTIQELFELDYGRMNALLGTELQFTNFTNQTTHQMNYTDLATEVIPAGQQQVWMIIHNGVDTHFVHFHLFNVQVINRVDWAGVVKPPYPDEYGWRDTIRADPLEQVIVAVKPAVPTLPAWGSTMPHSIRANNISVPPSGEADSTYSATTNPNPLANFYWEFVWHCHLLGHEENDMMRPLVMQVPTAAPAQPTGLSVTNADPAAPLVPFTYLHVAWDWNPAADAVDYYRVKRCDPAVSACAVPADFTTTLANVYPLKTLPDVYTPAPAADKPFYDDTSIVSGTNYVYQVEAHNYFAPPAGTYSTPSAPSTQLAATWVAASGVTLTPAPFVDATHVGYMGTAIVFTAAATGSGAAALYNYQFSLGGVVQQAWSANDTWALPANTPAGTYTVLVEARTGSTGVTTATSSVTFDIVPAPATSVILTADQTSTHIAGTAVTFSASGRGGTGVYKYRWLVSGPGSFMVDTGWATSTTWTLPASAPVGNYQVMVDVTTATAPVLATVPDAYTVLSYDIGLGVTFIAGPNGTITGSLVQPLISGGSTTPVTAVPAPGYHFVNWTEGGVFFAFDNPLTMTNVTAGHQITANFAINVVTITFVAGADGSLTGTTSQTLNYGQSTTAVTAVPNNLYHFVNWTGTGGFVTKVSNPLTVTSVMNDMTITANFDVGTTMVPDGDLGSGVTINDAYTALLLSAGIVPVTPGDLAHGDCAPLVGGRPQPNGVIDIGDAVVILRKALGIVTW